MGKLTNTAVDGPLGQDQKDLWSRLPKNLNKNYMVKYKKKQVLTIALNPRIWGPCLNLILNQENLTKREIQTKFAGQDVVEEVGGVLQRVVKVALQEEVGEALQRKVKVVLQEGVEVKETITELAEIKDNSR